MLNNIKIENILFLDIETVPQSPDFELLEPVFQKLWLRKAARIAQNTIKIAEETEPSNQYEKAGIYSEFGKIICISVGTYRKHEFRIKHFSGDNEEEILKDFADLLNTHFNKPEHVLCAHNGKEFDFPYIARRMIINQIPIPSILDLSGKKPWEVGHLDTMELWKFGDYKNYTSLELLASIFNIPTPKDDIDGSQVANVYYKEKDLARIVKYCNKDVLTVARILFRFKGLPTIEDAEVIMVD